MLFLQNILIYIIDVLLFFITKSNMCRLHRIEDSYYKILPAAVQCSLVLAARAIHTFHWGLRMQHSAVMACEEGSNKMSISSPLEQLLLIENGRVEASSMAGNGINNKLPVSIRALAGYPTFLLICLKFPPCI